MDKAGEPRAASTISRTVTVLRRDALFWMAAALLCTNSAAETLRVGPNETISRIADAAGLANDGDTIEIMPGTYRADVAVWRQKSLTIRGLGARPVLLADGASAEDKAIWVVRDGNVSIENIEFRGARVPDGNGAGIRLEGGHLRVTGCRFIDNQIGILTANAADAELRIANSEFSQAPVQQGALPHLLYAGRIARLEVTGSRFHQGYRGHLIKSRARRSEIRYNLIYDGPSGQASYEIDLPNGGRAYVVGNVIGQASGTRNPVVVAFGAEGDAWPDSALYLAHNTLLSDRLGGAWFLRTWPDRLPPDSEVVGTNNLAVGPGAFTLGARGTFRGNAAATTPVLNAPETLDFSLPPHSPLRHFAVDPGEGDGRSLAPTAEFALPIGTRPLSPPEHWAPGAFQGESYAAPPRPH